MKLNNKYIGGNHTSKGIKYGGIYSSFNGTFTNEEVLVETGISDIIPCMIGNIEECYDELKSIISNNNITDFKSVCEIVFYVVYNYFGDYSNISERMNYYKDLDFIESDEDIGKVSDLKGKNAAMCVERAMLSQNLLKSLGIDSTYKCSGIKNNGNDEMHAYNLIKYNEKYYIFDSTIPTLVDGKISPIITEVPENIYNKIISPLSDTGASVEVEHYNPLASENKKIVYDAGRELYYKISSERVL